MPIRILADAAEVDCAKHIELEYMSRKKLAKE
jgi:hypothetical protein